MRIKNGKIFIDRSFVKTDIEFDSVITAVGPSDGNGDLDAEGCYIIPGLVDVHTHGAVGQDFSDGNEAGLQPMSDYYAAHGVTSYLATTMTLPEDVLTSAMYTIRDFKNNGGAKCAGIHLEGPFLSYEKRGAQAAVNLHKPDAAMFHRLNAASGNKVRLVTVACEEDGGMEFIEEVSKSCTVSLGHTTADYDRAMKAYSCGASHTTHLYNGMNGLHHRSPGLIAAAMESGAGAEIICDGLHVHPAAFRIAHRLFRDKLILISDSLRCAGMPDGEYELGGQPITLSNGVARISGTDTLAGSSISLLDALRKAVAFGLSLTEAVYAASTAPADAVGLTHLGRIKIGCPADLVVLNRNLEPVAVFIDGSPISLEAAAKNRIARQGF